MTNTPPPNLPGSNDRRFMPPSAQPPVPAKPPLTGTVVPRETRPFGGSPDETPRERANWALRGCLGCLLLVAIVVGVAVLVTGGSLVGLLNQGRNWVSGLFPPQQASVTSTQTILLGVESLGQVVSTSAQLAQANINVTVNQSAFNACGYTASHVAQGTIEAGVDLTAVDAEDVQYDAATNTYTITLPQPQLTSCRVDFIDQYAVQVRNPTAVTCNRDIDDARQLGGYQALTSFRDSAIEGGILTRAQRDARTVVGNFVNAVTGATVNVVYSETAAPLPTSCQPQPPQGWAVGADGRWTRTN